MPISQELLSPNADELTADQPNTLSRELKDLLERAYGVQFTILDGQSGDLLYASPGQPLRDWETRAEVCREVARRGRPAFIDDEEPLLTLALPLSNAAGSSVAVATFLTRHVEYAEDLSHQADLLGIRAEDALTWAQSQTPWTAEALKRLSDIVLDDAHAKQRINELQKEANSLSVHLASTYEEISLLHRLTQNLKISKSDAELGRVALEWLQEVVPAAGLALQLLPVPDADKSLNHDARSQPLLLSFGDCPIDQRQFSELIAHLGPNPQCQPMVVNRAMTDQPGWPCPQVRQMIAVALAEGDENVFGWLAALNHVQDGEFGTVEASLLSSVAAILGIHSGNIELYRQQSDLLAGIVRALTSAVDAKDPYTCGHSDRVARIAVRLAQELGCDSKTLNTLYLAGLLHDIGKIGVDDSVLRKAGKLSEEEYQHIKQHVEIGHRILHDLAKLQDVLPVVLHHHEAWDGGGYPHGLGLEKIPLSARVVAVADAFDAMSSNRPYRQRMPDDKVDQILRAGAGRQWDPAVIDAFFSAREDIRRICREDVQPSEPQLAGLA